MQSARQKPQTVGNCAGRGSFYFSQLAIPYPTYEEKKKKIPLLPLQTPGCSVRCLCDLRQIGSLLRAPVPAAETCVIIMSVICQVQVRIRRECDGTPRGRPRSPYHFPSTASIHPKKFLQKKQLPKNLLPLSLFVPLPLISLSPHCLTVFLHHRFFQSLCPSLFLTFLSVSSLSPSAASHALCASGCNLFPSPSAWPSIFPGLSPLGHTHAHRP